MAARFTGDVSCFATTDAVHPMPANGVATMCEFWDGLARDGLEFGGFVGTALTQSAWTRGEPGSPAMWTAGFQSVRHLSQAGVGKSVLRTEGTPGLCRFGGECLTVVMGGRPWGIRFQGKSTPENGFDKRDRGPSSSRFP